MQKFWLGTVALLALGTGLAAPHRPLIWLHVPTPRRLPRPWSRFTIGRGSTLAPTAVAASGRVLFAGPSGAYGNYVCVSHNTVATCYAHLADMTAEVGNSVSRGSLIGLVYGWSGRFCGNVGGSQRQGGVSPSGTAHPPRPRYRVARCSYIHVAAAGPNIPVGAKLPEGDTPPDAADSTTVPSAISSEALLPFSSVSCVPNLFGPALKKQTMAALCRVEHRLDRVRGCLAGSEVR